MLFFSIQCSCFLLTSAVATSAFCVPEPDRGLIISPRNVHFSDYLGDIWCNETQKLASSIWEVFSEISFQTLAETSINCSAHKKVRGGLSLFSLPNTVTTLSKTERQPRTLSEQGGDLVWGGSLDWRLNAGVLTPTPKKGKPSDLALYVASWVTELRPVGSFLLCVE